VQTFLQKQKQIEEENSRKLFNHLQQSHQQIQKITNKFDLIEAGTNFHHQPQQHFVGGNFKYNHITNSNIPQQPQQQFPQQNQIILDSSTREQCKIST
jgi:hypothetical protein